MINIALASTLAAVEKSRVEVPWLDIAFKERGQKEIKGFERNNLRILEYLASFPYLSSAPKMVRDPKDPSGKTLKRSEYFLADLDETAWCAAFVNWCLKKAGQNTAGMTARAKDWTRYGSPLLEPKLGAIAVVFKKPSKRTANMTTSGWHVAFFVGGSRLSPVLFGGNQKDSVCTKAFHGYKIVEYRWPAEFVRDV